MANKIRRNAVLKSLDIKETESGKRIHFSMVFVTKQGERIFVPRAVSVGLSYSLTANRLRGILPIDINGEKMGHVYPVCIDNILEYNSMEVIL